MYTFEEVLRASSRTLWATFSGRGLHCELAESRERVERSPLLLYFSKQLTLQTALGISSLPDELQDMINRGAGLATPQAGGRPPMRPGVR